MSLPLVPARAHCRLGRDRPEPPGVRFSNRSAVVRPLRSALHPRAPRDTDLGFRKARASVLPPRWEQRLKFRAGVVVGPNELLQSLPMSRSETVGDCPDFANCKMGLSPSPRPFSDRLKQTREGWSIRGCFVQRPSLPRCTHRLGSLVAPLLVRALRLRVRPAHTRNRSRLSASPANGPASLDIEFRWLTDDARLRLARCGRNSQLLARLGRPAWEQVRQVRPGTAGPRTSQRIWDGPSAFLTPAAPS